MRLDVALIPAGLATQDSAGRTVVVIDVLRATTTICAALAHGARAVIPCASSDEAARLLHSVGPDVLLAGERHALPIPGFHLGNSPGEMQAQVVAGKLVALATTNGTRAFLGVSQAAEVLAVAAVNFSAVAERVADALAARRDVLVVCAGREGRMGLDDAYVAGRLVHRLLGVAAAGTALNDSAIAAMAVASALGQDWEAALRRSAAAQDLERVGLGADVHEAARVDELPVVPVLRDSRLIAA
jgi:2-phosphosulfolactate phosphatase